MRAYINKSFWFVSNFLAEMCMVNVFCFKDHRLMVKMSLYFSFKIWYRCQTSDVESGTVPDNSENDMRPVTLIDTYKRDDWGGVIWRLRCSSPLKYTTNFSWDGTRTWFSGIKYPNDWKSSYLSVFHKLLSHLKLCIW